MSETWFTFDLAGEEVTLTMSQVIAFNALLTELGANEHTIDHWHMCDNGCCVMVHVAGFDETGWRIASDGECEYIDRYGNTIVSVDPDLWKGGDDQ